MLKPLNTIFHEVEAIGILPRFQKSLHCLTGLSFDFVDVIARHSTRLRASRTYTDFCRFVHTAAAGRQACEACTARGIQRCIRARRRVIQTCHMGLRDVYVPLVIRDKVIGVMATGQMLFAPPGENGFRKIRRRLAELGLDPSRGRRHFFAVPVFPRSKLEAILDLISVVTQYATESHDRLLSLGHTGKMDRMAQACEFLEARYQEQICLPDVAAAAHLSPSRLSHLFRERLRTTFTEYLNDLRLEKAAMALSNTDLRIAEVAWRVGFSSVSHFNHLFKRQYGLSPGEHRNQQNRTND